MYEQREEQLTSLEMLGGPRAAAAADGYRQQKQALMHEKQAYMQSNEERKSTLAALDSHLRHELLLLAWLLELSHVAKRASLTRFAARCCASLEPLSVAL
jgi:hypothetical protein